MMDEYEKPTVGIPQLDGSKDIPGKIQQRSGNQCNFIDNGCCMIYSCTLLLLLKNYHMDR